MLGIICRKIDDLLQRTVKMLLKDGPQVRSQQQDDAPWDQDDPNCPSLKSQPLPLAKPAPLG